MIDITTLDDSDAKRWIKFTHHHGAVENGTLKSWNGEYLFVWFHSGDTAAACEPEQCSFGDNE